jgi:hypothetical protein
MTTKRNLLLVSLLLVFGLAASAPFARGASTPLYGVVSYNEYTVRYNSNADALGSVTVTFTNGGQIGGGNQLILVLGYGTFTINGSGVPSFSGTPVDIVGASGIGLPVVGDFCTDTTSPSWCGTAANWSASANILTITGQSGFITVTNGQTITLYGLRIDPIGNPAGALPDYTIIDAALYQPITHVNNINLGGPSATPGTFGAFELGYIDSEPGQFSQYPSQCGHVLTCKGIGPNIGYGGGAGGQPTFTIEALESWAGAFTALSDELVIAPYAPSSTKAPTNGSDISITVSGIPAGVTVTPGVPAPCPINVGNLTFGAVTPTSFTGSTAAYGGVVTFDFPFVATTHADLQCADYPFTVNSNGAMRKHNGPMWVSIQLDPAIGPDAESYLYEGGTETTFSTATAFPSFEYPYTDTNGTWSQENASGDSEGYQVLQFADCVTYLMYPYVTNYTNPGGGAFSLWDTAITYSNTTSDPLTAGSAIPQNGACTAYFYTLGTTSFSSTTPPAEATPVVWISPPILSGGIYGYFLSQTPGKGMSGYIIAECNFTNGHGYAQTFDNALAAPQVLSSYLPYTIPTPYLYSRAWNGEGYGEFAITPVDMDKLLHKIIHNIWKAEYVGTHP